MSSKLLLLIYSWLLVACSSQILDADDHETVQIVPYGKTAILKCTSNDRDHNFLFWQTEDSMIGPYNKFDERKYDYEVLSGNLTIKSVSFADEGIYNCFSRGVRKTDFSVTSLRVVVEKDWEEVYEKDNGVNIFRIVVVMGCVGLICGGAYMVWRIWKDRYRHPSYLEASEEDEDEDSNEEIFSRPSTSRGGGGGTIVIERATESDNISTDFVSILESANSNK